MNLPSHTDCVSQYECDFCGRPICRQCARGTHQSVCVSCYNIKMQCGITGCEEPSDINSWGVPVCLSHWNQSWREDEHVYLYLQKHVKPEARQLLASQFEFESKQSITHRPVKAVTSTVRHLTKEEMKKMEPPFPPEPGYDVIKVRTAESMKIQITFKKG